MLYAIISQDVADSRPLRAKARPEHLARLELLRDEGRLILAGPCPAIDSPDPGTAGFTGSIVIAEFESLENAEQWASEDPYMKSGVYDTVAVKPFKLVLP
jgi:uncharacterized protein YciI